MKIATTTSPAEPGSEMLAFAEAKMKRSIEQPRFVKRMCHLKGMKIEIVRLYEGSAEHKVPIVVFARYRYTTLRKGETGWRFIPVMPRARFLMMALRVQMAGQMKGRG